MLYININIYITVFWKMVRIRTIISKPKKKGWDLTLSYILSVSSLNIIKSKAGSKLFNPSFMDYFIEVSDLGNSYGLEYIYNPITRWKSTAYNKIDIIFLFNLWSYVGGLKKGKWFNKLINKKCISYLLLYLSNTYLYTQYCKVREPAANHKRRGIPLE